MPPIADPPVRKSGHCVVCGHQRPLVAVKDGDPFCSATCARDWHRKHNPSYPREA